MASSLGHSTLPSPSPFATVMEENILSQFQDNWSDRLNLEELFLLIDGVLPFEVCLYYQVLPMSVEGTVLNLGAVSPADEGALSYVRRLVSYLNYSIALHPITSGALQTILSNYLKQTGSQPNAAVQQRQMWQLTASQRSSSSHSLSSQTDFKPESPEDDLELLESPTVAVDLLDLVTARATQLSSLATSSVTASSSASSSSSSVQTTASRVVPKTSNTPTRNTPENVLMSPLPQLDLPRLDGQILDGQIAHLPPSPTDLQQLTPLQLLQILLGRILKGGIGRLYFERHTSAGKIMLSQDGVVTAALNDLPLNRLQAVIDELKRLAQLRVLPIRETQQCEVEYQYEQTRILLRFRFMRKNNGEEATVQVLKGAALKFYQQQQITHLERDAVNIAKQLQTKLHEIRDRAHTQSELTAARFEILPELSRVLTSIETQLNELTHESI